MQRSHEDVLNICSAACLRVVVTLHSTTEDSLVLHILERPAVTFPRLSLTPCSTLNPTGSPYNMPSLSEFQDGWRVWDLITLGMIPPSLLHSKPIDLRHKPLFYLGHLPTFLNLLMTAHLKERPVEPVRFTMIFERGIDPHVDDPEYCHSHSEVPEKDEDWPVLGEVLAYRDRVRERLMRLYEELGKGERTLTRRLARTLMMVLEHDGFHVETLLYILIQRAGNGMLPPPGFAIPPWKHLAAQWDATPAPATPCATLGPCTLTMGHDDQEPDDILPDFTNAVEGHEFGWDNESPKRTVAVGKFNVSWRPITNSEFLDFWRGAGKDCVGLPPSWVLGPEGEVQVRTLYGSVPMDVARRWPVLTAYDDLAAYAASKGGRIPTEPELRLFLDTYQVGYEEGANTGFRNWHPMPATAGGEKNDGRGSNGGVWEWTSTLFDKHEGFAGTAIFPGYSSDFYDTKHQVVLGASYATIPRLGDRRTVRNFYQHNYPYPWVGARVAYDC
ncbi:C-type lectin protein [Rhodofomes roseus]|uniref:C-type lectin protein n=1 Tax=Rhodofomes roseus TaxID=34475 RepID=A0ABQ8KYD7_9APHY|nr:C-type lectin protein [Rhodofomes roseus]KAH9843532.1 C-type lectin protein [Rhodofomes roseus]